MPRGNKEGIMHYTISLPSLDEQRNIVEEVTHWYQLINKAKVVMEGCEERKRKIVQIYI